MVFLRQVVEATHVSCFIVLVLQKAKSHKVILFSMFLGDCGLSKLIARLNFIQFQSSEFDTCNRIFN